MAASLERVEHEGTRGRKQLAVDGLQPATDWWRTERWKDVDDTEAALDAILNTKPGTTITRYSLTLTCRWATGYRIPDGRAIIISYFNIFDDSTLVGVPLPSPIGDGTVRSEDVSAYQVANLGFDIADGDTIMLDPRDNPIPRELERSVQVLTTREDVNAADLSGAWVQQDEDTNAPGDLCTVNGQADLVYMGQSPLIYKITSTNYYIRKHHMYIHKAWLTPGITASAHAHISRWNDSGTMKVKLVEPA